MPTIAPAVAAERLAKVVEQDKLTYLGQVYSEIFPETPVPHPLFAHDVAGFIRAGLAPEEIVDLWHVVFPGTRRVWYDEETNMIHYNEVSEYVD